jgi:hypothetical protein
MKHLFNTATNSQKKHYVTGFAALLFSAFMLIGSLVSGCKKGDIKSSIAPLIEIPTVGSQAGNSEANVISNYTGLSDQTIWELQQARAATAKYRNIENAIRDGYADISVDVEHMGHHFMKTSIVDAAFDIRQPEILVYNKNDNGEQELVAVEYAIPLSNPLPEGFSGSNDVWDGNSGFPFWLLHAWVWSYNPDGVFTPTNPRVHLH